ncbi:uncharacterized protein [Palaemon carinicauda]
MNYQSYSGNGSERMFDHDLRDSRLSRSKRGAASGRGKKLKKPEPPLLLAGIPRLDHSFVMAKNSDEAQNKDEISSSQDKTTCSFPEPSEKLKVRLSRNNDISSSKSSVSTNLSSPEETQMCNDSETTMKEEQNAEASTSEECVSEQELGLSQVACVSSENSTPRYETPCDLEKKTNPERCDDNVTELPLQDPVELEKETKKYYEELLGVKGTEGENSSEKNPEDASISASQVASITKNYDSLEEEKAKEDKQQKEIETAWSILHQYWQFVRENPYDFNGWTYLLTHVENMDNLEAARSAFEGFLPLYPYCFAYWKKLSDMEVKHKETERALGVLLIGTHCIPLCTDLWMPLLDMYISYAKKKELPSDNVRQLYEYGLQNLGHSWHSSCFWEGCISYELHNGNLVGVMSLYKRLLAMPTKLYNKHWDHFLALVRDHHPCNLLSAEDYEVLRKQTCEDLKIKYTPTRYTPNKSLKKTPQPEDKLSSRMKEKLVASYIKTHESNEEQVDKRWKFEERIKRPYFHIKPLDKKQIKNWKEYLDFEINEGDPIRIVPLFERCLVACAQYEEFWCQYASFMERHVQNIIDGKYKDISKGEGLSSSIDEKDAGTTVSENQVSEASTNENIPLSNDDGQVNSENVVDIKDVENIDDSVMRGSDVDTNCDSVTKIDHENSVVQLSNNDSVCEQNESVNNSETLSFASGESNKDRQQSVAKSEPPSIEQIKSELCANMSLEERVLKCALLTPDWIMTGVSWEDVRQIYRRGAWIHCPNKPSLLMQWAEFEEIQGNLDTARELLNTAIAKYPTLLKARMQLIELERRAGCYERVEELYGDASRALTLPRQRSWLAIKYARFLFKVMMEADRALAILRKALKKDRGYVHLYHHVFDICYQRQPLDCRGVLASVLLALTSKELPVEDKYWFAYKRVQFLREHGDILTLKAAIKEQEDLREQAGLNIVKDTKTCTKKSKGDKKEEEKKPDNEEKSDEKVKIESTAAESSATTEVTATPPDTFTVPNSVPPPNQLFPVPYFSADGAITYSPMEGYGYGHADPNQNLPTAQEVVLGVPSSSGEASGKEYHSVPPSWELNIQIGSYGYGNSQEQQWQQRSSDHEYDSLVTRGYPDHLKDSKIEEVPLPMPLKIDHLRYKSDSQGQPILPDLSQPPPGLAGSAVIPDNSANSRVLLPTPHGNQSVNRPLLPTPPGGQATNKVLLPTPPGLPPNFTRPPPPLLGIGPPGLHPPPGFGPPGSFQDSHLPGEEHHRPFFDETQHFGKRQHSSDYRSDGERPYKMQNKNFDDLQQYRAEYDNNYTSSPVSGGLPNHTANFGSHDSDYDTYAHPRRDVEHPNDHFIEERPTYCVESSRLNEPKRYSLRDETFDTSIPREIPHLDEENLNVNIPDWLVNEGGKLCLSDTSNGVSVIRYWPNFMTSQGHSVLFRVLRKRLKWYQRRAMVDGQWHNLPHLLSWIGPCDYSYSGVTLEKNTDWLPEIVDLLHRLIRYTGNQYNCCYLSLYRNGYDTTSWTSEDHIALRKNPSIASVSLGATRVFEMRRKNGGGYLRFPLQPGSLLLMEGATQEDWTHQFPKEPNVPGERIHTTFRKFYMIEGITV